MSEQPQNENENENVRDIRIHVRPGFTRRPGTLRLRQKFFRLSAQAAELEELAAQNDKKAQKEALKLFVKYDMLLEHVLRIGCEVEGGTIDEALDNLSADEADELFRQVLGIGGSSHFFGSNTNGTTPEAS
jgi:hypothetical protein